MLHEILPFEINSRFLNNIPDKESNIIFIRDKTILLKVVEQSIILPRFQEISDDIPDAVYVFSVNKNMFFLANNPDACEKLLSDGYQFYDISVLRKCSPKWLCFAAATAYQFYSWYNNNRFCGKCGKLLKRDSTERMLYCDTCGNKVFPKISPVAIVGIVHNDKILLTKYADTQHSGYALIAGFCEIGETIEETVRREVMEEAGLRVKNITYYKSQPWAFSDTLLLGFFCELDGSDKVMLDGELSIAEWKKRDEIDFIDDGISLTYDMISRFKKETNLFNSKEESK